MQEMNLQCEVHPFPYIIYSPPIPISLSDGNLDQNINNQPCQVSICMGPT
uniref:Uncharacterized protein n=1 Tax=Picea glauca TaxID=3330 RepID=A0A101M2Y8_PICGL|nr:hypothetical protein ABT39_MTgene3332 [Picea glauca]QHR89095.1 hypothetical protein Q903MT_gene3114 [Picea sitchensis]